MKFLTCANKIALLGTAAQLYPSCRCCQQHLAMASTGTDDQIPDTADAAPQIITPTYSRDQRSSMAHGQEINLHIYLLLTFHMGGPIKNFSDSLQTNLILPDKSSGTSRKWIGDQSLHKTVSNRNNPNTIPIQ